MNMKFASLILLMCLFSFKTFAQQDSTIISNNETSISIVKIGVVDKDSILNLMPEVDRINREYATLEEEYKKEYDIMVHDYNRKVKNYIENAKNLNETIKMARQAEITTMEGRIEQYKINYQEALNHYKTKAYAPLIEKMNDAIKKAAAESSVTLLLEKDIPLYISTDCIDITPLVISILDL